MIIDQSVLSKYQALSIELKRLKKEEMDLRIAICEELLANAEVGTHRFEIDAFDIKAVKNVNTKLDRMELHLMNDQLTDEEIYCIEYKPSLVMAEYKKLKPDERLNLDACIIVTPGAPTLTVT